MTGGGGDDAELCLNPNHVCVRKLVSVGANWFGCKRAADIREGLGLAHIKAGREGGKERGGERALLQYWGNKCEQV
jgi:hypothetical protein